MTPTPAKSPSRRPLRIGILGAGGQLGTCLVREIEADSTAELAFATRRADLDLSEPQDPGAWLDGRSVGRLDLVINAAAHTRVDACESEADLAHRVNALAPTAWARELAARDVGLIQLSTDYVFAGDGDRPYRESDPTDPKTVYGASKLAGEVGVLEAHPTAHVVRTSWVFGPGRNFVAAILEQAAQRRRGESSLPLRVVDDQVGSPTSAADLARALLQLATTAAGATASGLLHLCNAGETTWYGFAREILRLSGHDDVALEPVPTGTFETRAPRPAYSVLDCARARSLGITLRPWTKALAAFLSSSDAPRRAPHHGGVQAGVCEARP